MSARPYIHENFLLETADAQRLFHEVARDLPIVDYHNHLNPAFIADDHRFADLAEAWLAGDHYKWRALRANGVDERFCTGDAPGREKFQHWADTLPQALGNPLYDWAHLELKRYFDLDVRLGPDTAQAVWDAAHVRLAAPGFSCRGLLARMKVETLCTTDDPADDLAAHARLAADPALPFRVYPTFRPDRATRLEDPAGLADWVRRLSARSNVDIGDSWDRLLLALRQRHEAFGRLGCRLSDHSIEAPLQEPPAAFNPGHVFRRVLHGHPGDALDRATLQFELLAEIGRLNAARGWTMQLHIGALRNNATRLFQRHGPDAGADAMGDFPAVPGIARLLDRLDRENALPRTILYNLNPKDSAPLATLAGTFQDGVTPGKVQYGAAWWFLDQKDGIEEHLRLVATLGLLGRFVGMLTDSRSFLSFPRHEYFRRLLCNWMGGEMTRGRMPRDFDLAAGIVRRVCVENARTYFGFEARP